MKIKFGLLIIISTLLFSCNSKKTVVSDNDKLEGTWKLNYISGPRISFEGLFPEAKPTINFDFKEVRISGKNSCNNYSCKLDTDGNKINFDVPMITTKMFCPGEGENIYMSTLKKINTYAISEDGKTLNFMMGDVEMMRFEKL